MQAHHRQQSLFAARADVELFAAELPGEFVVCRALRHNWKPARATRHSWGFEVTEVCSRCTTERHREVTARGEVQSNSYTYPDGYLSKAIGRLDGEGFAAMRVEALTRLTAEPVRKSAGRKSAG